MLIWCLAESNTKILGTLNNVGEGVVRFLMSYLAGEGLGIGSEGETDGMEVEEGKAKKGKKVKKVEEKKERVPLFVALAAGKGRQLICAKGAYTDFTFPLNSPSSSRSRI